MTFPPPAIMRLVERVMNLPPVRLLLEIMAVYGDAGDGLLASGLAFSALFAALAAMMLIVGIAGFLFHDEATREAFVRQLTDAVPPLAPIVSDGLIALSSQAGALSIIALAGLAWSSSQFYGALDAAFARIFRRAQPRNQVVRIIRGFIALAIVVVSITLGIVISSMLPGLAADLGPGPLGGLVRLAAGFTNLIFGVLPIFVAACLIYRLVPNVRVPWSVLLPPGLLAGLAIAILTEGFVILAPRLVGGLSIFGGFATVFAALIWLSWSFQALLIGAAWTAMRLPGVMTTHGPRLDELGAGESPPTDDAGPMSSGPTSADPVGADPTSADRGAG